MNTAWWIEMLSAPLLVASMIASVVILFIRREWELSAWVLPCSIIVLFGVISGIAWFRARRRFETSDQALVRIEAAMGLHNRLSSAKAGVSSWPGAVSPIHSGVSWHWPRLVVPPLGAIALVAAGLLIPISQGSTSDRTASEKPQSWNLLESELEHLTQEELVDETYLEETRERLSELEAQEEDQWFSHASLEASDNLMQSHRAESNRMQEELQRGRNALENLMNQSGGTNEAEKNKQLQEYEQALQGLQNGQMKPNKELLEQMKSLNPESLGKLSPEQLEQLRENMKKNAEALRKAGGQGGEGENGEDWSDELLDGQGDGENGDEEGRGKPGSGGITRGPGHSPGVLGKGNDRLDIGDLTGLESKDLSKASIGDLLELEDGQHDPTTAPSIMGQGGTTEATGKGGERVWRESLDPDEQRALKRFFE